jgi:hypothetical protein
MSINALTNAAVARRPDFVPLVRVPNGLSEIAVAAAGMPAPSTAGAAPPATGMTAANGVNTALQALFGYIPTEVLTLYVAVLAVLHPSASGAAGTGTKALREATKVTPVDWAVFYIFLAATPVILWLVYAAKLKSAQKPLPIRCSTWPVWEMFAATVAYSICAFALSCTPFIQFDWYSPGLAGLAVLLVSTVLGLLAPLFQNKLGT